MDIRKINVATLFLDLVLTLCIATAPTTALGTDTGPHSASGTYTWNSTTGVLAFDIASSDFTCDGPSLGPNTNTEVTITATTMTWPKDNMTWSRLSGTAGAIVGTWTSSDSASGNSYTLAFNADNALSLTGVIVACGGGGGPNPAAMSQHWSNGYYVQFQYVESPKAATAVSVTGPGITGSKTLNYDAGAGSWNSWTSPGANVSLGTAYPAGLPYTYTFSITDVAGPRTATSTVSCFQQQLVTNISPSGAVTITPTFSWTGIADSSAIYGVQVNDSTGNWLWANYNIPGTSTSIAYGGPALTLGMTYGYVVTLQSSSTCSNQTAGATSFVSGSFTYGSVAADTTAPTVPTGVNVLAAGSNQVNVSWTASTDAVGVTGYNVYRNGTHVGSPAGTSYSDTGLTASSGYGYTVAACDAAGNCSVQSNAVAILLLADATITLDGAVGDWSGINALAIDPQGDTLAGYTGAPLSGSDIKALYAAKDTNNLYLRLDLWDAFNTQFGNWPNAPYGGSYRFNIASNSPTHASLDLGVAYGVNPGTPNSGKWSVGYNGAGSIPGTPETDWSNYVAVSGGILEMKIPLANIGNPTSVFGIQMEVTDCCILTKPITTLDRVSTTLGGGTSAGLVSGWNLLGNGLSNAISVSSMFGNSNLVSTVWKWIASTSAWAFYTPTLGDGGAAYASSKGYTVLTTIDGGEGFWVNAKDAFPVQLSGNAVPTSRFADGLTTNALPTGWSLISIGDNKTPGQFANAIALNPPAAGTSIATSLTTLWAWDATVSGWYFYAPSLVNAGTQSSYINSKTYLDFTTLGKTLTPTTGFWVNHP